MAQDLEPGIQDASSRSGPAGYLRGGGLRARREDGVKFWGLWNDDGPGSTSRDSKTIGGILRKRDWDEPQDFARFVRFVRYSRQGYCAERPTSRAAALPITPRACCHGAWAA